MPWNVKRGLIVSALGVVVASSSAFTPSTAFVHKQAGVAGNSKHVNEKTWPLNYYVKPEEPNGPPQPKSSQKTLEEYVKDRGGDRVIKTVLIGTQCCF
jgi:hypothetical protein